MLQWARAQRGVWDEMIAQDIAQRHGRNITKQTALTKRRRVVNGAGDTPNMHNILTGTQPDRTAFAGAESAAMAGHNDRTQFGQGRLSYCFAAD